MKSPSLKDMYILSNTAMVSFAARNVRRLLPIVFHYWTDDPTPYLTNAIITIEHAEEYARLSMPLSSLYKGWWENINSVEDFRLVEWCADTARRMQMSPTVAYRNAWTAADVLFRAADLGRIVYYLFTSSDAESRRRAAELTYDLTVEAESWSRDSWHIWQDFALLREVSKSQKGSLRINDDFYALRSSFIQPENQKEVIKDISTHFESRWLEYYSKYPKRIQSLTDNQFKEVVAELLLDSGFSVDITQRTKDHRYDIVAIKDDKNGYDRFLIECRRKKSVEGIGTSTVASLHGQEETTDSSRVIVATTFRFLKNSQLTKEKKQYKIDIDSFDTLRNWLHEYQKSRMNSIIPK